MPTSKEMSVRRPELHKEERWIDWAQTHSMCKALDSPIWFAEPHLHPCAGRPSPSQVRINQQDSVNESSTIVHLPGDMGKREPGESECGRIVFSQLHCPSGQANSFGNLMLLVDDPARPLASAKTPCGCGIRRREIRIKFDSFVKQA